MFELNRGNLWTEVFWDCAAGMPNRNGNLRMLSRQESETHEEFKSRMHKTLPRISSRIDEIVAMEPELRKKVVKEHAEMFIGRD